MNPSATEQERGTRQVELAISNLLRFGVMASLLVIVAGTVVTFVKHPDYVRSEQSLRQLTGDDARFPRSMGQSLTEFRAMPGRSLVTLGLLLLVATPVMRVAVSVVAFLYERDFMFAVITAVVLALLIVSFAIGKATGG